MSGSSGHHQGTGMHPSGVGEIRSDDGREPAVDEKAWMDDSPSALASDLASFTFKVTFLGAIAFGLAVTYFIFL
ncbi:MAG: hypothetical protein AB7S26_13400 [Sandaracinaceae bacterium]